LPASAAVGAVAALIATLGVTGLVIDAAVGAVVIAGIFVISRRRPHDQGSAIEVDVAATSVLSRRRARRAVRKGRVDTPASGVEAPFVRMDDPPEPVPAPRGPVPTDDEVR